MKSRLFVLFFLLTTNFIYGQNKIIIPKGINKITLSTEFDQNENLRSLIRGLKDINMPIQTIDTISYQIITYPKNQKSYTYSLFFNIYDNKIEVSGFYNTNTSFQVGSIIFNDGGGNKVVTTKWKNTIQNDIFLKMKEIMVWIGGEKNIKYNFEY